MLGADFCLRRCKAAMNKIAVLPAGLEEIEMLEELELGHNHIVRLTLPDGGLLMLPNLKKLHLEANRILELPVDETETFESLSAVRSGSGTRLTKGISGLTSLTELRMDCNQLLIVPPDVGRMTALETLLLAFNRIQWLPVELGELKMLTKMTLEENPVMNIRPELAAFEHDTRALVGFFRGEKEQNLRNQGLTTVPPHVATKLQLQELYLSYNDIAVLPPALHVLHDLRTLHADHNHLFIVEPWIGSLTSLTDLALDQNRLLSLPAGLGLLTRLQTMTVEYNSLSSLPRELGLCTSLQTLHVEHNPLRPPFSDALEEGGMETLMDLIFELGADCNPPSRANTQQTMRFSRS